MSAPKTHYWLLPIFCTLFHSGVVFAQVEIPILQAADNYVQQPESIEFDIRDGQELVDADLVIGRPLDGTNLWDNLNVNDHFPRSLYAGFLAKIKPTGNTSNTYIAAGHIKVVNPPLQGLHFTLSRDLFGQIMDGTFFAAAAFDTPQPYPLEKLLGAEAIVGGHGGKLAILVGDSASDKWWVSNANFKSPVAGEPAVSAGLNASVWRVLNPDTLELGDEESPASFDRVGIYMEQSLHVPQDPERNPVGNRGFSTLTITVAE